MNQLSSLMSITWASHQAGRQKNALLHTSLIQTGLKVTQREEDGAHSTYDRHGRQSVVRLWIAGGHDGQAKNGSSLGSSRTEPSGEPSCCFNSSFAAETPV